MSCIYAEFLLIFKISVISVAPGSLLRGQTQHVHAIATTSLYSKPEVGRLSANIVSLFDSAVHTITQFCSVIWWQSQMTFKKVWVCSWKTSYWWEVVKSDQGQYVPIWSLNPSDNILSNFVYFVVERNQQGFSVMLSLKIIFWKLQFVLGHVRIWFLLEISSRWVLVVLGLEKKWFYSCRECLLGGVSARPLTQAVFVYSTG